MLCCLPELYIPRINEQSRLLAEIDFLFLTLLYFILPYPTGCSEKLCFPRIQKKMPSLHGQHWAAIGRSKNGHQIVVTVQ